MEETSDLFELCTSLLASQIQSNLKQNNASSDLTQRAGQALSDSAYPFGSLQTENRRFKYLVEKGYSIKAIEFTLSNAQFKRNEGDHVVVENKNVTDQIIPLRKKIVHLFGAS